MPAPYCAARLLVAVLLLTASLAGCGYKGDLVLPQRAAAVEGARA